MKPAPIPILFTSAGRRVELIECFRDAARELGQVLRILAVDANPRLSPACHFADHYCAVPRSDEPGFVDAIVDYCRAEEAALVVPTIDPDLHPIALARSRFDRIGTTVAVSDPEVVQIARDKLMTWKFLRQYGIDTPRTEALEDARCSPERWRFPVVMKPRAGSSSKGVILAHDRVSLLAATAPNSIVQEYLAGSEYTVNLFFDRAGLRCAIPHRRIETRGGEVSKGITVRSPVLLALAQRLGAALEGKAFGALCFQAIMTPEGAAVTDLNARFGGGYPLAHRAGGKFARWLLEGVLDGAPSTAGDTWREGIEMLRYDASVFVQRPECASAANSDRELPLAKYKG